MNQRVNTGHGNSMPKQESFLSEGFPRTRSRNSLISDDVHDDGSFWFLQAAFNGLRQVVQAFKQLVERMMVPNEEQIPRGPDCSAYHISTDRMNQRVNTGHGNSMPQQESFLTEGFPRTRSGNSLISDDAQDDDSFWFLQAAFNGLRQVVQAFKQLVEKMMVPNEEQISRGPDYAVGRNPKVCSVCKTRVVCVSQIPCCHIVCQQCLPFNDGKCRVCKEPVDDTVAYDIHLQNVARRR